MTDDNDENDFVEVETIDAWNYIVQYKSYARFEGIPIPWFDAITELENFALNRRSQRTKSDIVLSKEALFKMLRFSAARQESESEGRCYPSAGARYPLEVYLLVYDVEGLEEGAYHYSVLRHELIRLWDAPKQSELHEMWRANDPDLNLAKMVFFFASLTDRSTMKYDELGSYFPLIECGYIGSMIHQYAHQIGIHFCPLGAQCGVQKSDRKLHP